MIIHSDIRPNQVTSNPEVKAEIRYDPLPGSTKQYVRGKIYEDVREAAQSFEDTTPTHFE